MEYSDDDGIILNVVKRSTSKTVGNNIALEDEHQILNKRKLKYMKYSRKFMKTNDKRMTEGFKQRNTIKMDLMPYQSDEKIVKLYNKNESIRARNKSYQSNDYEDERINKYHEWSVKNPKSKNKFRSGYHYRPKHSHYVLNTSIKIYTPAYLAPEASKFYNNIDKTPLYTLNLHKSLTYSLLRNDIGKLTDIQLNCYPAIFAGRDAIVKASTGSGKTLAYLIPLVNQYLTRKTITARYLGTIMLVICSSRELCVQGNKEALRCLKRCPYIVPGCLIGGEQTNHEKTRIRRGINILFCTPGRLLYHLANTQCFKLDNLKTIVFYEADRTLDMGFQASVTTILYHIANKHYLSHLQKILVSAHFNYKVETLIKNLSMDNSAYIGFTNTEYSYTAVNPAHISQYINISSNLKQQYLLMSEEERIPLVIAYLKLVEDAKVLIFVNTIDQVEYLDFILNNLMYRDANGVMTDQRVYTRTIFKMHGNLDQKLRSQTYFSFRQQNASIMISTEVASRGLDFLDISHIILFDVPPTLTDYGNRVGRSARFNSSGISLLMLHYQYSDYAETIRYYAPTLELLDKEIIYGGFDQHLENMNIRYSSLYYLYGVVRGLVKDDDEKYKLARRAYVSMLRAYAKLPDKHIFAIKRLDLKLLGRGFGINSTGGRYRAYNPKAKYAHLYAKRKRRKVYRVYKMLIDEYL